MIRSYCKINLSLRVLNKLKSKLHNIQTNSFLLNFYDEITVKRIKQKKDIIVFKGKFGKNISKTDNSVLESIKILRENNYIKKNCTYKLVINKHIPIFSGLGGGTSNAAFLSKYFIKKKISKPMLNVFSNRIGSDFILFSYNQLFQKNLKTVIKYKKKFIFYFLIVYPNIKCSTEKIYSQVKKYNYPTKTITSKIKSKSKFIEIIKNEKNDLQTISASKFPLIQKIVVNLGLLKGCHMSRMTGSGSACFGMFESKKLAKLGLKAIQKKFPKYWCVVTKTI